jgi:hypothetical protein
MRIVELLFDDLHVLEADRDEDGETVPRAGPSLAEGPGALGVVVRAARGGDG